MTSPNVTPQNRKAQTSQQLAAPAKSLPAIVGAFFESVDEKHLKAMEPAQMLQRFLQGSDLFTTITEQNAFSGRPETPSSAVDDLLESAQEVVDVLTDYEAASAVAYDNPENALLALAEDVLKRVSADPSDMEAFLSQVEQQANSRAFSVLREVQGGLRTVLARHLTQDDIVEAVERSAEQAALWLAADLKRWLNLQTALGTPGTELASKLDPKDLSLSCDRAAKREENYRVIVARDEEQDRILLSKLVPALDALIERLHEPSNDAWVKSHAAAIAQGKIAGWEQRALRHRLFEQTAAGKKA